MKLIEDFKKSKTIKFAWLKIAAGFVGVIMSNMGYFEGVLSPTVFGATFILLGIIDKVLRELTTQSLGDK